MILVCFIVPALIVCLVILYAVLVGRFFLIKSKIPVLGFKGVLNCTAGRRRKLAAMGALFFIVSFGAQVAVDLWAPDMLMAPLLLLSKNSFRHIRTGEEVRLSTPDRIASLRSKSGRCLANWCIPSQKDARISCENNVCSGANVCCPFISDEKLPKDFEIVPVSKSLNSCCGIFPEPN